LLHLMHICPCLAKWAKFKTIFVKTRTEIWRQSLKDFLNSTFWCRPNFVPFCLVHEWNIFALHKYHSYLQYWMVKFILLRAESYTCKMFMKLTTGVSQCQFNLLLFVNCLTLYLQGPNPIKLSVIIHLCKLDNFITVHYFPQYSKMTQLTKKND
jgi:hypothetical protein